MKLVAFFDGGCSLQRGVAGAGAVLYDEHGTELATATQPLWGVGTPTAEYTGLHLALGLAGQRAEPTAVDLVCWGDAELIVRQVDGRYRCTKAHLVPLRDHAWELMRAFGSCEVKELPKAGPHRKRRFLNSRADELAGHAMQKALASQQQRG